MRLIDADDFRDEWRWQGQEYSPQDIIEEIDDAPTIDAIPVEWIEDWFKKALKYANDGDDVTVDVMLDDWRREHETG